MASLTSYTSADLHTATGAADALNRVVAAVLRGLPDVSLDQYSSGIQTTDGQYLYTFKEIAQALEDGRLPWAITAAGLEALRDAP